MKRLLSAVQRMYPTDPSRSADFQTTTDLGRGVAGSGSHKQALLEAEARGEVRDRKSRASYKSIVQLSDECIRV